MMRQVITLLIVAAVVVLAMTVGLSAVERGTLAEATADPPSSAAIVTLLAAVESHRSSCAGVRIRPAPAVAPVVCDHVAEREDL
jgi:hypothetical protein